MAETESGRDRRPTVTMKSYEIHVRGELPGDVLSALGGLHVIVEEPQTVLRGPIRGQTALHGILLRLQRLGIELVEMRRLPDEAFTGCATESVEIVVIGALGDVTVRAFADVAVERRQVLLVASASDTLDVLSRLTARGVEVLAVRERLVSHERPCSPQLPLQSPHPGGTTSTHQVVQVLERLTDREREVLGHLSELLTTAEIAEEMFISVNTVRTHIRSILRKLAASRRNEAVRRARALELIPIRPGGGGALVLGATRRRKAHVEHAQAVTPAGRSIGAPSMVH